MYCPDVTPQQDVGADDAMERLQSMPSDELQQIMRDEGFTCEEPCKVASPAPEPSKMAELNTAGASAPLLPDSG
eukprot:COSAG03_NODE_1850_length_3438_cov_5.135969_2_plen_74_part_00